MLQPLLIPNVAENIASEIDDGLLHESDKEEMMRRVCILNILHDKHLTAKVFSNKIIWLISGVPEGKK